MLPNHLTHLEATTSYHILLAQASAMNDLRSKSERTESTSSEDKERCFIAKDVG